MRGTIITKTNTNTIEPTDDNNENAAANNNDLFFERKIQEDTAGLAPYYSRVLSEKVSKEKALIIADISLI
ncbi:MAG: hypothetical protein ACJ712_04255 [Nitrososphaeraceae archaeon]